MKVLLVNKFFYPRGGAENSFFETEKLLLRKGHETVFFSMHHPKNLQSPYSKYFVSHADMNGGGLMGQLKTAVRIHYSFEAKRKIEALIDAERPDIAYLNNISHQLSPSIIDSLKGRGIPIVMNLRDYKLTCPVYTHLRDGLICEDCSGGHFYKAFLHRCTKGSILKSAVNMTEMYLHHKLLHIYNKVDEFMSPSRFLIEKTREMGFKAKINYLPNFIVPDDFTPAYGAVEKSIVFIGRLSGEKGVATLIEAVKGLHDIKLKIIGDGPLMDTLKAKVKSEGTSNVVFMGFKHGDELKEEIRRAAFTVIPSEWFENNPRTVLEAFALGKPVIGARIGGIPELVKDGVTGFTFKPGDVEDLRDKIKLLWNDRAGIKELGENAREFVIKEGFNPESHYTRLMEIFDKARVTR